MYHIFGGDLEFTDPTHIGHLIQHLFTNMEESNPLPVQYYAALALDKIIKNWRSHTFMKDKLHAAMKCYLRLMNKFYCDDIIVAFDNLMKTFPIDIKLYAVDICNYLKFQYIKCMSEEESEQKTLTTVPLFSDMYKIIDHIKTEVTIII